MTGAKIRQCAEGLIITAAGLVFLVLSLNIRDNPVAIEGALNLVVQAKFIPIVLSVLIAVQGIRLTFSQWKGNDATPHDGGFTPRALTMLLITAVYLILVSLVGFLVPTIIYIGVLLFLANRGRSPLQLLGLTALYSALTVFVIPGLLNLQLI